MRTEPKDRLDLAVAQRCATILRLLLMVLVSLGLLTGSASAQEETRSFGYIPVSKEEFNSYPKTSRYRSFLPESVDLSAKFPAPRDQGRLNSCTGWAVGYARSFYAVTSEMRKRNQPGDMPSPSYIYHSIRTPDDCQSGSKIPVALLLLASGSLSLAEKPYSTTCWQPTIAEQSKATDFKIDGWRRVVPQQLDDVKGQIARGHPVIFGMNVGKAFIKLGRGQTYKEIEGRFGAHAMTAVGYSDRRQAFKIINSWGTNWGEKGFGWIAYDKFKRDVSEAYVMRVKSQVPAPRPKPLNIVPEDATEEKVVVTPYPKPPRDPEQKTDDKVVVKSEPKPVVEPVSDDDCSMLTISEDGTRRRISGFVGTQAAFDRLREQYSEPTDQVDVKIRPWPQCEVLITLGKSLNTNDAPSIKFSDGQSRLVKGNTLAIDIVTPRHPSYIYISYVQADGSVVHLHQPAGPVQSPSKSKTRFVFGDGKEGRAKFTVTEPYGREMIVVLASASPLFEPKLSEEQIEREYLSALRKALIFKADPRLPDRDVSAAFLGLETREE